MIEILNPARSRMENGQYSLGVNIRLARTVEIAPLMKTAGYDWLFIDLEHGPMSLDTAAQMCVTGLASGIAPIVRVPKGEYAMATRLLDNGALGIVIPHVESTREAAEIVDRLKFPPVGHRSVAGTMPHLGFRNVPIGEASKALNSATLLVAMIETPLGMTNAREIAEMPGIDVVMVGANDLCTEMGIPGDFGNPRFAEALKQACADVHSAGKWAGIGGLYNEALLQTYLAFGIEWILAGSDVAFTLSAATGRARFLRDAEEALSAKRVIAD